jgi:DNA-binding cell septation regulator SpoVG
MLGERWRVGRRGVENAEAERRGRRLGFDPEGVVRFVEVLEASEGELVVMPNKKSDPK